MFKFIPNLVVHREDGITEIFLTRGKVAIIDTDDYSLIKDYKWCAWSDVKAGRRRYYAWSTRCGRTGKSPLLHRNILSDYPEVDHKNGDTLDNRRSNLRPATHRQNLFNQRKKKGSSRYRGVNFVKKTGLWRFSLRLKDGSRLYGWFCTEKEAWEARRLAELIHCTEFEHSNVS